MDRDTNCACTGSSDIGGPKPLRRRPPILRSVILLAVTTVALALFIVALGDLRRKHVALGQGKAYTAQLQGRVGEAGLLPLNLSWEVPDRFKTRTRWVEWLSRQDARALRNSATRLIAAQTAPIARRLAPDGRAVIFFGDGRFELGWLRVSQFDRLAAAQRDELRRCKPRAARP